MSMLSTLDALEATEGASVPRAGVFQPKVKARVRKGGGRGDGSAKPPPGAPVAAKSSPAIPVSSTRNALDLNKSTAEETEISEPSAKAANALIHKEVDSALDLSNGVVDLAREVREISPAVQCVQPVITDCASGPLSAPAPANDSSLAVDSALPESSVAATTQESQLKYTQESCTTTQENSQSVAVTSNFPAPPSIPSTEDEEGVQEYALARSEELSSNPCGVQEGEPVGPAKPAKLRNSARKTRKSSTTPAASDTPSTSSKGAVDDDLEETLVIIDDESVKNFAMQEEHADTSSRKRRRDFRHSTSRPKGQRQDRAESSRGSRPSRLDCDLSNPSALPLREVIRRAENIERRKAKEEMAKKSLLEIPKSKGRDAVGEPEPPRDVLSLAPQVQVVNGRIVVNEQSLTVGAYATTAQDTEQYTRVEEKASRLNYHTYSNRTVTERWKTEETNLFYKAIRQFGTDFDLIRNLFPSRTRRQIKAKYKKEETANPQRVADALTYRPRDQSHYEEMLARMKRDDVIDDTSNPFASILAYSAEKAKLQGKDEVDDNQAEEDIVQ